MTSLRACEAIQIQVTQSGLLRSATNDKLKNIPLPPSKGEFRKLVNFSVFEKSIFSSEPRNDVETKIS